MGEEISFVLRITGADPALLAAAQEAGWRAWRSRPKPPPGLESTRLPVLHKGVLIDPYQLYESRLGGADGVVLIAAAFDGEDDEFVQMHRSPASSGSTSWSRSPRRKRSSSCSSCSTRTRSWCRTTSRTAVDLERTFSLLEEVPAGKVVLSEGGIHTRDEVLALERAGVDAAILGDWVHELGLRTRSRSCAAIRANSAVTGGSRRFVFWQR